MALLEDYTIGRDLAVFDANVADLQGQAQKYAQDISALDEVNAELADFENKYLDAFIDGLEHLETEA
jgi:hypothetical protein